MERISDHVLGYRCTNADPGGRYTITKEVIGDSHLPCLLHRTQITGNDRAFLAGLKIFVLCVPHLEIGAAGNNGYIAIANGPRILMAQKDGRWLAMGAPVPF
jgi:glucoamylase